MQKRMMEASETFLKGSTDFEKPIKKAISLIQDEKWNNADKCEKYVKEMQSKYKFSITGILLDEGENMSFSLEKFAKKIYRTSELCKDDIAVDIMKNRR